MNFQSKITKAIQQNKKVLLQMHDTEDNKYIIFHPYALVTEIFKGEISVMGLVEKHYVQHEKSYYRIAILRGIKTFDIMKECFEVQDNWEQHFDFRVYEIIISIPPFS